MNKLVGEKSCEGHSLFGYSKESHSLPGVIIPRFLVLTSRKMQMLMFSVNVILSYIKVLIVRVS